MVIPDKGVQKLKEIKVPDKFYNRILTGNELIDQLFGGDQLPGIVPGSSTLVTGNPGAGKSTLTLQLADMLQENAGKRVLVNVGEESKFMIKIRGDRLQLKGDFLITQIEQLDDLIMFCEKEKIDVLVQDSLQVLHDGDASGHTLTKNAVRKLVAWKGITGITQFLVGQVTKSGQFAGPKDIQHAVDTHAHMKNSAQTGSKVIELTKNRNGPATVPYELSMSAAGLAFKLAKEEGAESTGASAAQDRRDRLKATAVGALVAGEKLSGYCFTRLGLDCSGGYWRGVLALACKELSDKGEKIKEEKIDGRTYFWIAKEKS
jgi:predicted ATP-dependent serine protease